MPSKDQCLLSFWLETTDASRHAGDPSPCRHSQLFLCTTAGLWRALGQALLTNKWGNLCPQIIESSWCLVRSQHQQFPLSCLTREEKAAGSQEASKRSLSTAQKGFPKLAAKPRGRTTLQMLLIQHTGPNPTPYMCFSQRSTELLHSV